MQVRASSSGTEVGGRVGLLFAGLCVQCAEAKAE